MRKQQLRSSAAPIDSSWTMENIEGEVVELLHRKFGFAVWQDEKIFFHQTEVLKTGLKLEVGCKVKFNVGQDPWQKDKLKAYKVKVVAPASNEREWANFMQSKKKSVR